MKLTLLSSDNVSIELPLEVALGKYGSETILHTLEDTSALNEDQMLKEDLEIPVPNVDSETLRGIVDWQIYRQTNPLPDPEDDREAKSLENIDPWDKAFMENLRKLSNNPAHPETLIFKYIQASNYLNIKPLLALGCKTVAAVITYDCKTDEDIRQRFGLVNDFTPEEYEKIKNENEWAEE